jgi:hypothetical protein
MRTTTSAPSAVPQLPVELARVLAELPYADLLRIDLALEGAWSETVRALWTPASGVVDPVQAPAARPGCRPALELYFPTFWVGVPCWRLERGECTFDRELALIVIAEVERRVRSATETPPSNQPGT